MPYSPEVWMRRRADRLVRDYYAALERAGLSPRTPFEEYESHLRAEGANSVLMVLALNHPEKLAHDPDAQLADWLKKRLELADRWLRGGPMPERSKVG